MTIVFVHGVPETGVIWNGVRAHLGDEKKSVALDLPGFGTSRPVGFGATKDEYAAWLADAGTRRGVDGGLPVRRSGRAGLPEERDARGVRERVGE